MSVHSIINAKQKFIVKSAKKGVGFFQKVQKMVSGAKVALLNQRQAGSKTAPTFIRSTNHHPINNQSSLAPPAVYGLRVSI